MTGRRRGCARVFGPVGGGEGDCESMTKTGLEENENDPGEVLKKPVLKGRIG
jgi:hypothetical protein